MRNHLRQILHDARRFGDRIDAEDARRHRAPLGADVVRLARLATSIHLGAAARQLAARDENPDPATTTRGPAT